MELLNRQGLSYIASGIGIPLCMDKATKQQKRLSFAKVCIEVDIAAKLPNSLRAGVGGASFLSMLSIHGNLPTQKQEKWVPKIVNAADQSGMGEAVSTSKDKGALLDTNPFDTLAITELVQNVEDRIMAIESSEANTVIMNSIAEVLNDKVDHDGVEVYDSDKVALESDLPSTS
ncbi:unnamed protein product [Dovyalis caffra]|uniref:Uncharacterized protein n=1 Tax=Dovyalis caffra TaxID=77055 RepID=A0AAV1RJ50_9ROSI|nr:unnamed protein product [Dovyalis caffra]